MVDDVKVSMRPAPKGGCGADRPVTRNIALSFNEARPEGRVRRVHLHDPDQRRMVSMRPAPQGGCGRRGAAGELRDFAFQ